MRFSLLLLILTFFYAAPVALAQSSLIYGDSSLTIDLDPPFPGPDMEFTATANDYAFPLQVNTMRWFYNGVAIEDALNARQISTSTREAGAKINLKLVVETASGESFTVERTINPVYLDIIIEPQTRTPAFYRGRALPSLESNVNVTALINAGNPPSSELLFTWQLNGRTLERGTIRGNNTITFPMPRGLYANLGLEVKDINGVTIAKRIINLTKVEPELEFYEFNQLYGIIERSVGSSLELLGSGIALRAEPYYLDLATYNRPDFLEWKINGTKYQGDFNNPYEISLAAEDSGGSSQIGFHVRNTKQVLQGVERELTVSVRPGGQ